MQIVFYLIIYAINAIWSGLYLEINGNVNKIICNQHKSFARKVCIYIGIGANVLGLGLRFSIKVKA